MKLPVEPSVAHTPCQSANTIFSLSVEENGGHQSGSRELIQNEVGPNALLHMVGQLPRRSADGKREGNTGLLVVGLERLTDM